MKTSYSDKVFITIIHVLLLMFSRVNLVSASSMLPSLPSVTAASIDYP